MSPLGLFFSFNGRIGRLTYWVATLGHLLFLAVPISFQVVMTARAGGATKAVAPGPILAVWGLTIVAMLWSTLAVQVKRWHDRDKSGWWFLIGFVPFIGNIWTFVELGFLPGSDGSNSYGSPPGSGDDQRSDFNPDSALQHWRSTAAKVAPDRHTAPSAPRSAAASPVVTRAAPGGGFGRRGLV